jgi:uncharacterized protein YdeI (YjbR/CyaY-like superfamily)
VSAKNPEITTFMDRATRWQDEMRALREILLECDVGEELKWGKPCYTAHGGNIVVMQPFKDRLALMFFKGALLDDPEGVLREQGEATRSALRMEFESPEDVTAREAVIRAYVAAAIEVEASGRTVPKKKVAEFDVPAEFERRLREDDAYRAAFEALTPGRKKSYLLHFAGAKRAETRERRIEKCRPKVLEGKGFNER